MVTLAPAIGRVLRSRAVRSAAGIVCVVRGTVLVGVEGRWKMGSRKRSIGQQPSRRVELLFLPGKWFLVFFLFFLVLCRYFLMESFTVIVSFIFRL